MYESEEEDLAYWGRSTRACDSCAELLTYTEEVVLLQICTAHGNAHAFEYTPLVWDDTFAFHPYLMHFMCWERVLEEVREITQDVPPHDAINPVLICTVCESLIGSSEAFISVTHSELHVSQRSPSGTTTDAIEALGAPDPVCLECFANAIEEHFPTWEDVLTYMPEGYLDEDDQYNGT